MIRPKLFSEIESTIAKSHLLSNHDFDIKVDENENISITYLYDDKYNMIISIPNRLSIIKGEYGNSEDYKIDSKVCPGEMSIEETETYIGKNDLLKGISKWLQRVVDDLKSAPINRFIFEQDKKIKNLSKQFDSLDDNYLSKKEIEEYRAKLDDLYKVLEENIKIQTDNNNENDLKIEELKKEIETLKMTVECLSKKNWLKSLMARIIPWLADERNQKSLKAGANVVKALLPSNISTGLEDLDV